MYGGDDDEVGFMDLIEQHFGADDEQAVVQRRFVAEADELYFERGLFAAADEGVIYGGEHLVGANDAAEYAGALRHEDGDMFDR